MISWMQKHRKYLVVTIWISTIAFVGAGFVGWGTYQYGKKSHSVAQVGDISITYDQFQLAYNNAYRQYNQMMGGRLDEATAKKLGLEKQVLNSLIYQGLLKNFAKDHGIVVSDEEVQQAIVTIPAFQKNGKFDKEIYLATLRNMGLKPKTFEANMKNDLLIRKTLALLSPKSVPLEIEAFGAAVFMADKLKYKVFDPTDVNVSIDEQALKKFWEAHKERYMTPKRFKLGILWIEPSKKMPDEARIDAYYKAHRSDFTNDKGEILSLEEAKQKVIEAIRLKDAKKSAQLAYIDLKKGRKTPSEEKIFDDNDPSFDPNVWQAIEGALSGTVLKPKVVDGKYAVIKVEEAILPRPKTFQEAYAAVKTDYLATVRKKALMQLARKASDNLEGAHETGFVTRDDVDSLPPLSPQEAALFLRRLFGSDKPKGAILLDNKAVAYVIVEQKLLLPDKLSQRKAFLEKNANKIKSDLLQSRLIAQLQQKYPIQIFLKDAQ